MKGGRSLMLCALMLSTAVAVAAARPQAPGAAAQIPECVKYEAMIEACLPKMCIADRAVAELDLAFHRELLPTLIKAKGTAAAAASCVDDMNSARRNDMFGCYTDTGKDPAPKPAVIVDDVRASETSLVLTLTGTLPDGEADLFLATLPGEPPAAVYRLPRWSGTFVLDTATAVPSGRDGTPVVPVQLEPATEYCFILQTTKKNSTDVLRKGVATTRPKRRP